MDKNIEKQLSELFTAYDAKKEKIRKVKSEREEKESAFLSQFIERRAKVFRSAFETFAKRVAEHGIKCRIEEKEEAKIDQHQTQQASITIAFLVGDKEHLQTSEYPHLRLSCAKHAQALTLFKSTIGPGRGGQSGPAGEIEIDTVTEAFLQQCLLEILQQVLL